MSNSLLDIVVQNQNKPILVEINKERTHFENLHNSNDPNDQGALENMLLKSLNDAGLPTLDNIHELHWWGMVDGWIKAQVDFTPGTAQPHKYHRFLWNPSTNVFQIIKSNGF